MWLGDLQLEMHGYDFTIVHRLERMLEDANYFLRVGEDGIVDPLLASYEEISKFLHKKHCPEHCPEEISQDNCLVESQKGRNLLTWNKIIHQSTSVQC